MFVVVATEQLSAVTGVPSDATVAVHVPAPTFTVMFEGQVIVGFWLSFTTTVVVHVETLPLTSVAVKVIIVIPTGNVPDASAPAALYEFVNEAIPQLSVAVANDKIKDLEHEPAEALTVTPEGQVITGN